MQEAGYGKSNRWLTTLTVDEKITGISRNQIIDYLEKENIESRPVWKPMHLQPLYRDYYYSKLSDFDVSGDIYEKGLCLPSGYSLSKKDQDKIIEIILSIKN